MTHRDETLHSGTGNIASLAARCRHGGSSEGYYVGATLEGWFGEARRFGPKGETMFATFPSPWLMDQDRRCTDKYMTANSLATATLGDKP